MTINVSLRQIVDRLPDEVLAGFVRPRYAMPPPADAFGDWLAVWAQHVLAARRGERVALPDLAMTPEQIDGAREYARVSADLLALADDDHGEGVQAVALLWQWWALTLDGLAARATGTLQ